MGYTVYPVNPNIAEVDGERSYPNLASVPKPIDIVDVFRNPTYLDEVVDEAIAAGAKVLWTQLDVVSIDEQPERKALAAGMRVVYHFEQPHYSLRQSLGIPSGLHARQRFLPRTPAQAAGLTTRRVLEVILSYGKVPFSSFVLPSRR